MKDKSRDYDIIIIGAGLVGLSASLLMNRKFENILVIDNKREDSFHSLPESQDPYLGVKSIALSLSSTKIFEALGIWKDVKKDAAIIEKVHVSSKGDVGSVVLSASEIGEEVLGYNVANTILYSSLYRKVKSTKIDFQYDSNLEGISCKKDHVEICFRVNNKVKRKNLSADLLIVTDGLNSKSSDLLGIDSERHSSLQEAIFTNIFLSKPNLNTAYQRFSKDGHMALLPIPVSNNDHRSEFIWVLPKNLSDEYSKLSDKEFLRVSQQFFGARAGNFKKLDKRLRFPIYRQQAAEQIRHNIVIMGNSAHSIYPIAAQGFNLSLRDAQKLSSVLINSRECGKSIGSFDVLQDYLSEQVFDQSLTAGFGDNLKSAFAKDNPLARFVRSVSLLGFDSIPSLRKAVINLGVGVRGNSKPG